MADGNNPYVTVQGPSYATPLVNLFGQGQQQAQQQPQGQQRPQQQQPGGQPQPPGNAASANYAQPLGQLLSKIFGLGPMATQVPDATGAGKSPAMGPYGGVGLPSGDPTGGLY